MKKRGMWKSSVNTLSKQKLTAKSVHALLNLQYCYCWKDIFTVKYSSQKIPIVDSAGL